MSTMAAKMTSLALSAEAPVETEPQRSQKGAQSN